jgi:hypothetical protein
MAALTRDAAGAVVTRDLFIFSPCLVRRRLSGDSRHGADVSGPAGFIHIRHEHRHLLDLRDAREIELRLAVELAVEKLDSRPGREPPSLK